jgi:hypothetical protein
MRTWSPTSEPAQRLELEPRADGWYLVDGEDGRRVAGPFEDLRGVEEWLDANAGDGSA